MTRRADLAYARSRVRAGNAGLLPASSPPASVREGERTPAGELG